MDAVRVIDWCVNQLGFAKDPGRQLEIWADIVGAREEDSTHLPLRSGGISEFETLVNTIIDSWQATTPGGKEEPLRCSG